MNIILHVSDSLDIIPEWEMRICDAFQSHSIVCDVLNIVRINLTQWNIIKNFEFFFEPVQKVFGISSKCIASLLWKIIVSKLAKSNKTKPNKTERKRFHSSIYFLCIEIGKQYRKKLLRVHLNVLNHTPYTKWKKQFQINELWKNLISSFILW